VRIDEFRPFDGQMDGQDRLCIATVGFDLLLVNLGRAALSINPQVILQVSHDGGFTWGAELSRPLGRSGEYYKTIQFNRLGRSRDMVFKIVISEAVKVVICSANLDVEQGIS
jgi:hypothetical protein